MPARRMMRGKKAEQDFRFRHLLDPFQRRSIPYQFKCAFGIPPQEKLVIRLNRMNKKRNLPEMIACVISADSKNRRVLAENSTRSPQRFQLRAFDVHLDVRGNTIEES